MAFAARDSVATKIALALTLFVLLPLAAPHRADAIGLLIPKDRALPPLAVKSHRVDIVVTDQAAVTKIDQVFVNHTERQLEATFYFPVPPGSTVSDFSLWINGRKTPGAVLEKNKARKIYEEIVRRTQDPGLVEYLDGAVFQARIFPVPAHGEQKVQIAYASVLDQVGGMRRLTYPLRTGRGSAALMEDLTIVAKVESHAPLKAIYSPTHRLAVARSSDSRAVVSVEEVGGDLEEDLVIYMGTGAEDVGLSVLTYDKDGQGGDDGTFLMVLTPKIEVEASMSKAVTFVVDASGSMMGAKMDQAREMLRASLAKLRPGDRVNVIRFSTDVEKLFDRPLPVSTSTLSAGTTFAAAMEAAGGTAIEDAISTALDTDPGGLPHFVIFLTDGRPTVGSTDIRHIVGQARQRNRHGARVFTFGVGYDVNSVLLDRMAADHGGDADYVRPKEDIALKVTDLINKISAPALTDVAIDFGSSGVYDVYPRKLPDLFRGGQVVLMGRNRRDLPGSLKLSGRMGDEIIHIEYDELERRTGGTRTVHDYLPKLWATRKVGTLLDEIRANGELAELKTEIIRLATRYGLVTPYTSYLAVDDTEFDGTGAPAMVRGGSRFDFDDRLISGDLKAPKSHRSRAKKEDALRDLDSFNTQTGEKAVEASIATRTLKDASTNQAAANLRTRWVDGKLFVYDNGAWREDGTKGKKTRTIKYGSDEYMNLIRNNRGLRKRLSVGRKVVVDFADEAIMVE